MATQHQVQQLQEQYYQLMGTNKILVDEIVSLQKQVKAQNQVHNELINHLSNVDERRRSSRHSAHSSHSGQSAGSYHGGGLGVLPDSSDEPSAELRRARDILSGISPDQEADRELHRLSVAYQASPPDSATSSVMFSQPNTATIPPAMVQDPFNDPRHLVYPVGQTIGVDPFHPDHINSIPYTRPLSNPNQAMAEAPAQITPPPSKEQGLCLWGAKKPRILLVEDDKTCARIGAKFLSQIDCGVEIAVSHPPVVSTASRRFEFADKMQRDGHEAVNRVNSDPEKFDLIFMDIIMPQLDGVSAAALIREVTPRVVIVAMTSNIRQEDIATYFHWGE